MKRRKAVVRSTVNGLTKKARQLALNIDGFWKRSNTLPGPIDVIDFFSGCGGMSAGFRAANAVVPAYRLAMAVDTDEDANRSFAANLNLTPHRLDVQELSQDARRVRRLVEGARSSRAAPLVMIGCAPCQGFSSHRNSQGAEDERNSLFLAFSRIATLVKPDVVVVENVPEILTNRYWPLVDKARRALKEAGYVSRLAVHDMAAFGVPQHRFRALLIAMRRPFRMPTGFLPSRRYRTVRDAIGDLPPVEPGIRCATDPMHFTAGHRASTIKTIRAVPQDGGNRPWHAGPECLRRAEARQGRAAYEDVYGRLWWDRPAITVTAYARNPASGRYVHPEQHRGLSVREAALLQSFPRQYMFDGSFDSRFRQIGNAVPPAFSAYLAVNLFDQLTRSEGDLDGDGGADINAPLGPSFSRLIPALKAGHRRIESRIVRTSDESLGSMRRC